MPTRDEPASIAWKPLARDFAILILLLVVAFELFGQAAKHQPRFSAADIRIVEAPISSFTTVQVAETAAAPQLRTSTLVSRTAFRLADRPPNVLSYIHGLRWKLENDFPVGTVVRLEVTEDPKALDERARAFPDATLLQPIEGLQIGGRVYFRAEETIAAAAAAAQRYQRLGGVALIALLLWVGWLLWSWRRPLGAFVSAARGT